MTFDNILKNHDIEGTATNSKGDYIYLGKPRAAKRRKGGYRIQWAFTSTQYGTFDKVLIHEGSRLLNILNVPVFQVEPKNVALSIEVD